MLNTTPSNSNENVTDNIDLQNSSNYAWNINPFSAENLVSTCIWDNHLSLTYRELSLRYRKLCETCETEHPAFQIKQGFEINALKRVKFQSSKPSVGY